VFLEDLRQVGGSQSLNGQLLLPVWMVLRAQIVGMDSGYAREKRRLSPARASKVGVFIQSLP
jgi:hypothetical protein